MKRTLVFIHLFVALQMALPLYYYVGRRDRNDERFAWRMFSPTRMLQCRAQFYVGEARRPINPYGTFHEAWLRIARRGRLEVVAEMASHLCELHEDEPVYVDLTCEGVGGERTDHGASWDMCTVESL